MEKKTGGKAVALLSGLGVGAALMYVLDPERGRRRRALARDKAVAFANKTGDAVSRRSRDLANRAKGLAAEARSAFDREEGEGAEPDDSLSGGTKGYGSSPEARSATGEGEARREPRQMAGDRDRPRVEEEEEL
ncbi:MAG: hypothetical protein LC796_05215 [Acidobacteria bacterium]|nr:hypothetical protein [Acidobacteriota bacterium]MCA1610071.1 hypothetical protein [Acidobacteriota bacterium]